MIDLPAARTFLAAHGRLLDRSRFAMLADGEPAEPVIRALAAYANDDGGFGRALEPDVRAAGSQPIAVLAALDVLHEAGAGEHPLALAALDWLGTVTNADGGIPFLLHDADTAPHAPFLVPDGTGSSFHMTSAVTAAALRLSDAARAHPWVAAATEFCWAHLPTTTAHAYEIKFALEFLDAVPEPDRATAALEPLRPLIPRDRGLPVSGGVEGEELPLHVLTPRPGRSRALFDAGAVERALDAHGAAQRDDGGWDFDWLRWNPAVAWEWRGRLTVDAVAQLLANDRPVAARE
jgi:hypothetical protein